MRSVKQIIGLQLVLIPLLSNAASPRESGSSSRKEPSLSIEISSPKTRLLSAEPLLLVVRFSGSGQFHGLPTSNSFPIHAQLMIDRGSGFKPYQQKYLTTNCGAGLSGKSPLSTDGLVMEQTLGYDATTSDACFPKPGTYRVVLEYGDDVFPIVRSNVLAITVSDPTGDDAKVYDAIAKVGFIVFAGEDTWDWLDELALRYPTSPYLHRFQLAWLLERLHLIGDGYDPEKGPGFPTAYEMSTRKVRQRQYLERLLPEARRVCENLGPYTPDGLLLLAGIYRDVGDRENAELLQKRLVRDFKGRRAALKVERNLREAEEIE